MLLSQCWKLHLQEQDNFSISMFVKQNIQGQSFFTAFDMFFVCQHILLKKRAQFAKAYYSNIKNHNNLIKVEDSCAKVERRPLVQKVPGSSPVMSRWPRKWREYWLSRNDADIERD